MYRGSGAGWKRNGEKMGRRDETGSSGRRQSSFIDGGCSAVVVSSQFCRLAQS